MRKVILQKGATSPDALKIVEVDTPKAGPGMVVVRIKACSLNYRDQIIARGKYGGPIAEDLVPLSDGVGDVAEIGAGVTKFKVGDRVAATFFPHWIDGLASPHRGVALGQPGSPGTLAEYIAVPEIGLIKIAETLNYFEASTLPCAGVTAWNALVEGPRSVGPSSEVLVMGTGGVSLLALQIAKAAGARVIITSSSDEKLERTKALRADGFINYRKTAKWGEAALAMSRKNGFDFIPEVGGAGTLAQSFAAIGFHGEISMIGLLSEAPMDANPIALVWKAASIRAIGVGTTAMAERLNAAIDANAIKPVVDKVFPLADAVEAYRYQASSGLFGKVVITTD